MQNYAICMRHPPKNHRKSYTLIDLLSIWTLALISNFCTEILLLLTPLAHKAMFCQYLSLKIFILVDPNRSESLLLLTPLVQKCYFLERCWILVRLLKSSRFLDFIKPSCSESSLCADSSNSESPLLSTPRTQKPCFDWPLSFRILTFINDSRPGSQLLLTPLIQNLLFCQYISLKMITLVDLSRSECLLWLTPLIKNHYFLKQCWNLVRLLKVMRKKNLHGDLHGIFTELHECSVVCMVTKDFTGTFTEPSQNSTNAVFLSNCMFRKDPFSCPPNS